MVVATSFKEYVQDNNKTVIKVSLSELLKNDLTYRMFDEYMTYLDTQHVSIYEDHDGESYTDLEYTEESLINQLNQLVRNFSKKRVQAIKAIQQKLYKNQALEQRKAEIAYNNAHRTKQIVGSLFAAGGTALTVGAILFSGPIGFIVVGIVSIAGGVVLLLSNKES